MEKLNLRLQFSVLVHPHCWVWWLTCNEFKEWVDCDSLYEFTMAFKSLHLHEFAWKDTPQNWSPIERSWYKELRIFCPCEVNYISGVASQLSWVSPLDCLFCFAEFDRSHSESPYYYHLVVWTTCQKLSIGWKSGTINCRLVSALQIILMLRLILW